MSVGTSIQKLGRFLEECGDGAGTVNCVDFVGCIDSDTEPTANVELTVPVSDARSPAPERNETEADDHRGLIAGDVSIDDDGRLRIALETAESVVPAASDDLELEPTDAVLNADGTVTVTLSAAVRPEGDDCRSELDASGSGGFRSDERTERSQDADTAAVDDDDDPEPIDRNRNVPPFRDPDLLAEVYESCETFAEMSEVIDMDVTAETVRRYMIDYGIHEPNTYSTDSGTAESSGSDTDTETDSPADDPVADAGTDSEGETDDRTASSSGTGERTETAKAAGTDSEDVSPVVVTDGLGLPDDITVDTLVETVSRSNTIYEVKQDVGLERDETVELLRRLNLVDLVVGRVTTEHERNIGRETILDRLREASATRSHH